MRVTLSVTTDKQYTVVNSSYDLYVQQRANTMVYDTVLIVKRNDLQGPNDTGLLSLYPHVEYPKQTWFLVKYGLYSIL